MSFTSREWWGLIHGMGLGALFLLAFAGGLAGLYSLRPTLITPEGVVERMRPLKVGVVAMAITAWLTVLTGTRLADGAHRHLDRLPLVPGADPRQPPLPAAG